MRKLARGDFSGVAFDSLDMALAVDRVVLLATDFSTIDPGRQLEFAKPVADITAPQSFLAGLVYEKAISVHVQDVFKPGRGHEAP